MKKTYEILNELLLGCQMGLAIYKNYVEQVESEPLKDVLNQAIASLHEHEENLIQQIQTQQSNRIETLNFTGILSITWENLKAMTFTNDQQFLDASVDAIATALNALASFKEEQPDLDEALLHAISELEKDYRQIYDDLTLLK